MRFRHIAAAFLLAASCLAAHADPLVYTLSGLFTGTLGGSSFTNTFGTFSETADSSGVVSIGSGFYQNPGSVTLNLAGFAPVNFNTSFLSVESEYNAASFYDTATGVAVGVYSEDLGAYDLTSAIGPVTGFFVMTSDFSELSSGGLLTITGGTGDFTFSAQPPTQVTPEPSSLLLLSTGLLGAVGIFRRKLARRD